MINGIIEKQMNMGLTQYYFNNFGMAYSPFKIKSSSGETCLERPYLETDMEDVSSHSRGGLFAFNFMTKENEQKFNNVLYELKEILFKKVPDLDYKYAKMQNLDFADFEELKNINNELDKLRNKYVELRNELIEIDKEKGNIEIKKLNKEIRVIKGEIFKPNTFKKESVLYKNCRVCERSDGSKIAYRGNEEIEFRNVSDDNFKKYMRLLNKIWN